jgi:hypothetical protein
MGIFFLSSCKDFYYAMLAFGCFQTFSSYRDLPVPSDSLHVKFAKKRTILVFEMFFHRVLTIRLTVPTLRVLTIRLTVPTLYSTVPANNNC